jgi:hypothetical protein
VAGSTATLSGCAICPAGTYGSQLDHSNACKSCKGLGPQAISAKTGAASCANCTGTSVANADATACISGGGGESWDGFSWDRKKAQCMLRDVASVDMLNPFVAYYRYKCTPPPRTGGTTTSAVFVLTSSLECSAATIIQIQSAQQTFLASQPGVQAAKSMVTCNNVVVSVPQTSCVATVCMHGRCPQSPSNDLAPQTRRRLLLDTQGVYWVLGECTASDPSAW